ncbi:MAG: heme A synthase [Actinobacteria bacterium]|nr:heme A synthase [Actinomycetota bacterium]
MDVDLPSSTVAAGPPGDPVATTVAERFTVGPGTYRVVVAIALVLLSSIVVTGALVRLSGSGLGCSDWPNCTDQRLVQFGNPNQTIEQVNRLFTGLVSLAVIAAVLGSLRRRPYRRDLVWLSWGLVAGVVGQIVLGGITVLVHLHPVAVAGHFVLSMLLVGDAVVLLWRAGSDPGPRRPVVGTADLLLGRVALVLMCCLMVTGPAVTGTGPHAGDARAPRFGWFLPDVTRVHSVNMWAFLICIVVLLVRLARSGTDVAVIRRGSRLLAAIVVQGGIGYAQYELGIPTWLVALHIAGATTVLGLTIWFHLGLSAAVDDPDATPDPLRSTAATASNPA